jgi:cytochrome c peroxidase
MRKELYMTSRTTMLLVAAVLVCTWLPIIAWGAAVVPPPVLLPLNQIPVPEPPNLFQFVKNKPAAIKLGKALFWDMQAGSDGVQACGSCHFHAGADNRLKNTINPGTRGGDTTFQVKGPNDTLIAGDFPFHVRTPPDFQASTILRDSNDVVGSQGVKFTNFAGINADINTDRSVDIGTPISDTVFQAGGVNMRRVTARNTPTNINAVFNFNNFWDGRAHFMFNGVNPFGPLDPSAGVWFNNAGILAKQPVAIQFASLASQATGPPLDDTEMSFHGRTFPELGRKLLNLTPLGKQLVHPNDSVLGPLSNAVLLPNGTITGGNGLRPNYSQMIKDAFQNSLWENPLTHTATQTVTLPATVNGVLTTSAFSQMEANFSLFWGLAIQLYEATLVADQTPYDRFLGGDKTALTTQQQDGFTLFFGAAGCVACHISTELTGASVRASAFLDNSTQALIEPMAVASGANIIYDAGFNNTSVRPTTEDIGRGGNAPTTNPLTGLFYPLSFSMLAELQAAGNLGFNPTLAPLGTPLTPILPPRIPANFPVANDGNFKVPGLRNVELTAPYFHNGGDMTLGDVVDFYTRGGNFPVANQASLDVAIADIGALQNSPVKHAALVAFMNSMTDERVRNESAPFDHPEIFVPNGDLPDGNTEFIKIPARDANGVAASSIAITLNPVITPTNVTSQTISGTNGPGVAVSISTNGRAALPAAANTISTWSATLTGLAEGPNSITVTATDAAGNATTVTGSIILDTIAPVLAINAVITPVALDSQTLSGTVEAGIKPVISISSGATAGPVTTSNGVWSTTITGLAGGLNTITAIATDPAGNTAIKIAAITYSLADGNFKGTGVTDISDALKAMRIAVGLVPVTPQDLLHGDVAPLVNGVPAPDNTINIADALMILRKVAGLVSF